MAHIIIHHKVEDYKKWKPVFDEHSNFRAQHGLKDGKVFRCTNDQNEIFILMEIDNFDNAKKFYQSDDLKEVMKNAGVLGKPEVFFVEEVSAVLK